MSTEVLKAALAGLRTAVRPFAELVHATSGRIPHERLSAAHWHALVQAYDAALAASPKQAQPVSTGYKELDDAICAHIAMRPGKHPIYSGLLLHMAATALGRDSYRGDDKEWRLIDRRLQALKKAGRVAYARQPARWELTAAAPQAPAQAPTEPAAVKQSLTVDAAMADGARWEQSPTQVKLAKALSLGAVWENEKGEQP